MLSGVGDSLELKKHGIDCVYLDISHRGLKFIKAHFPNIYKRCLELGIDASKQPIPVVPAAHYTCGGINTTLDGLTAINGLYAVGQTADTGLRGASRPARKFSLLVPKDTVFQNYC